MPPGTSEVRHYHREAYQFFFILSGVATLEINGKPEILHPHEGAEVHPLTLHQMWNLSEAPMEFLVISQPNSRDDRVFVAAPPEREPQ
jgi:mannose-6-phosphate isomerase-like protein (cupin superfamily)